MLYKRKPKNFNPKLEVVGCFCEFDNKFLLLQRQDYKPQGGQWGLPGGKIDLGEKAIEAIAREINEETGLDITQADISFFKKVFVRYPDFDFVYHIFHTSLTKKDGVKIRETEHKNFNWFSLEEALMIDFIGDLDGCIKLFYKKE